MMIHLIGNIQLIIMHLFSFSIITDWSVRATLFCSYMYKSYPGNKRVIIKSFL